MTFHTAIARDLPFLKFEKRWVYACLAPNILRWNIPVVFFS